MFATFDNGGTRIMSKKKIVGLGFVVSIILFLALGQVVIYYESSAPIVALFTEEQQQKINALKDACDRQAAMALFQSDAAFERVHAKCQVNITNLIDEYITLNIEN